MTLSSVMNLSILAALSLEWSQTVLADSEASFWDKVKSKSQEIMGSEPVETVKEQGQQSYQKGQELVKKVIGPKTSEDNRSASRFSLFWEPFGFGPLMPVKSGWAAAWLLNADWTLELDYFAGGYGVKISQIDVLTITEKLITANARWYLGNSFNLRFGFGQRRYKFSLGDDFLAKITADEITYFPALEVQNEIITLGLGNRWQLDNGVTLGCDWLDLHLTTGQGRIQSKVLSYVKDESDRDDVSKLLRYMRYGPSFDVLRFYVGYTF